MANVYFHQGQIEKAEALYSALLKATEDKDLIHAINSELGFLFLSRNNTVKSQAYFRQALDHFKAAGQVKQQLGIQLGLAAFA